MKLPFALPTMSWNGHERVKAEDCFLFTRQLHVLQHSGVPLLASLQALQEQLDSPALKQVLRKVHQDLLEGRTFSQALAQHPRVFGPVYLGLIRVGETGGLLDDTLRQLAQLLEWEMELRNRLRDALQYPMIVLTTLSIALTVIAVFVLPRFAQMFESFHIPLPIQTRLLIGLSHLISHWGWLMALLALVGVWAWWQYLRTETGLLRWHTWKLRLPLLGQVFLQISMSRFARVTAAMTASGVPILETLALAGEIVNNRYVSSRLRIVRNRVKGGGSLAGAMKSERVFPSIVTQMVTTGEETGRLDELLRSVSDYYDQQVAYSLKRLITLIEPLLIVFVGLGVLLMATAVFVPMWDMVKMFKH